MGARVSFFEDGPKAVAGSPAARGEPASSFRQTAVQANGDIGTVFVVQGDHVERRAVRLGARNADGQIVLSGLQSGKSASPPAISQPLSDGARVHVEQ